MSRIIELRFQVGQGEKRIRIKPAWAGEGIAIHKPMGFDEETGDIYFLEVRGVWKLSHINSGMSLGICYGNLDRAKSFARQWDAEFAAVQADGAMAQDRVKAWRSVAKEMTTEPPIVAKPQFPSPRIIRQDFLP